MESQQLKNIVEAALLAASGPLTVDQLRALFGEQDPPEKQDIRAVLQELQDEYSVRGIELREVASGFRVQVREAMSQWLGKLFEERPPRYTRALMETLAIVAYRQPVTRGDIEEIRGVQVTSNIIRTLLERDWIKVVGHRDVPGKPAMFGTTREFLDYFGLKKLDDLPPLAELARLEPVEVQLDLGTADQEPGAADAAVDEQSAGHDLDADPNFAESAELDSDVADSSVDHIEDAIEDNIDDDSEDDFDDDAAVDEIDLAKADGHESLDLSEAEHIVAAADDDDESDRVDVPPGAVAPLVGLHAPDGEQHEPATVASLDDARAAAEAKRSEGSGEHAESKKSSDAVPLKSS